MKHSTLAFIALGPALVASMLSCNTQRTVAPAVPAATTKPAATQKNNEIYNVIGGEWLAAKVGDLTVTGGDRPYLIFDTENQQLKSEKIVKMYGNDGCNIVNGAYLITPAGEMRPASDVISTMRLCPDAPYEMGMTLALNGVTHFVLEKSGDDYLLNMKGANDSTLMILRKYDLNFINGSWAVTAINGKKVSDNSEMQLVFDTPELKIHGNVGCNTMNGSIVANNDGNNAISFTNMITTRMTCPDIEQEQALLTALSKVASASPFDDLAGVNLKDEAGNILVTLKRIELR